jgi:hypothetical protein
VADTTTPPCTPRHFAFNGLFGGHTTRSAFALETWFSQLVYTAIWHSLSLFLIFLFLSKSVYTSIKQGIWHSPILSSIGRIIFHFKKIFLPALMSCETAPYIREYLSSCWLQCNPERAGIVDLHKDVQTCGYHDVQVMWGMLGLEAGAPSAPERRKRSPFWTWTPSFLHFASSRRTGTAAAR